MKESPSELASVLSGLPMSALIVHCHCGATLGFTFFLVNDFIIECTHKLQGFHLADSIYAYDCLLYA